MYEVRENVPTDRDKIAGVTYDTRVATLTITLTDDGSGVLSASSVVMRVKQFINEYTTKPINPDGDGATAKAGIQIVKTLTGRPIAAGDFKFTMAPADDATKAKFGDAKVIATNAAELGTDKATSNTAIAITPVKTGLEFTLADVGKTYTFDLIETKGGGAGDMNDETKHTLTFTTADNDNGTLSVTATLDGKEAAVWTSGAELIPVSVGFANSYSAGSITVGGQGGVALAGTKQLTGRPMVAGEFHFNVTNAKNAGRVVATGTNAADGTITFTGIKYTTEKLNNDVAAGLATVDRAGKDGDVYTYTYKVSEDAGRKDKGVSIVQGEQTITVKVTDNRAGKLSAKVVYPEGGMVFKNAYGTGEGGSSRSPSTAPRSWTSSLATRCPISRVSTPLRWPARGRPDARKDHGDQRRLRQYLLRRDHLHHGERLWRTCGTARAARDCRGWGGYRRRQDCWRDRRQGRRSRCQGGRRRGGRGQACRGRERREGCF